MGWAILTFQPASGSGKFRGGAAKQNFVVFLTKYTYIIRHSLSNNKKIENTLKNYCCEGFQFFALFLKVISSMIWNSCCRIIKFILGATSRVTLSISKLIPVLKYDLTPLLFLLALYLIQNNFNIWIPLSWRQCDVLLCQQWIWSSETCSDTQCSPLHLMFIAQWKIFMINANANKHDMLKSLVSLPQSQKSKKFFYL